MRKLGEFLLTNDRNAAFAACGCSLLALFNLPGGLLAAVIVGLVTLCRGYKSGLFVLAWVALPAFSMLILHRVGLFDVILAKCVLVWLLACLLRVKDSWRLVLEIVVVIGLLAVAGAHFFIPDLKMIWVQYLTQSIKEVSSITNIHLNPQQTQLVISKIAPVATGLMATFVLLTLLFQLMLARAWQAKLFNPGALRKEFVEIRLDNQAIFLLVLVLCGIYFKIAFIIDFLPLVLLLFTISGLSLLHKLTEQNKNLVMLLAGVYIGLIFVPLLSIGLLVIAGSIDSWYDFRGRMLTSITDNDFELKN